MAGYVLICERMYVARQEVRCLIHLKVLWIRHSLHIVYTFCV